MPTGFSWANFLNAQLSYALTQKSDLHLKLLLERSSSDFSSCQNFWWPKLLATSTYNTDILPKFFDLQCPTWLGVFAKGESLKNASLQAWSEALVLEYPNWAAELIDESKFTWPSPAALSSSSFLAGGENVLWQQPSGKFASLSGERLSALVFGREYIDSSPPNQCGIGQGFYSAIVTPGEEKSLKIFEYDFSDDCMAGEFHREDLTLLVQQLSSLVINSVTLITYYPVLALCFHDALTVAGLKITPKLPDLLLGFAPSLTYFEFLSRYEDGLLLDLTTYPKVSGLLLTGKAIDTAV